MEKQSKKHTGCITIPYGFYQKVETRARNNDYTEAMSFEAYDPLWLLGRQWQFGRFQGNDCGSTVLTKIEVEKSRIAGLCTNEGTRSFSPERPLEYDVEKRPHALDPYVRIESALHFLAMKSLPEDKKTVLERFRKTCPLDPFLPDEEKTVEQVKAAVNAKMDKLYRFYGKKCFDGIKLYHLGSLPAEYAKVHQEYKKWFDKKYLADNDSDAFWNEQKLGYELKIAAPRVRYSAEDYHTGRLSWYSFDKDVNMIAFSSPKKVVLGALPTPATFPAAPNRRLWEFENSRVQFNDWQNDDVKALASSVIMQYTMMYSNDWMIVPLETEVGVLLRVKDITVKDSFGREFHIDKSFEDIDNKNAATGFTDRWAMYSNVYADAYSDKSTFKSAPGLLFPPTLQRVEQGAPIEEVQFLRDEMANMVWGVENVVSDGCGGSLDSRSRSDMVFSIIDERRKVDDSDVVKNPNADFSYLIQNRVPLHWIPFIPQNIKGESREIIFRRARMPIWYNGGYQPVEPSSQLLAVKREGKKTIPRYVYEEEILGYGTKVGLYPQRTRWFDGSSFTWQGFEKKISGVQANSGLMFDTLLDVEKNDETKTD